MKLNATYLLFLFFACFKAPILLASPDHTKFLYKFMYAAEIGDVATLQKCIDAGIDVNEMVARTNKTALHFASKNGHAKAVIALIKANKINVNQVDNSGLTALHYAAGNGHVEAVTALLAANEIKVNQAGDWQQTALQLAARNGHAVIVDLLLNSGEMDVDYQDNKRSTALHLAVIKGHTGIACVLIEHMADPNLADNDGKTPLDYATEDDRRVLEDTIEMYSSSGLK